MSNIQPKNFQCVCFIVPSVGRDSVFRTITSIEKQTNSNWKCIIMLDVPQPIAPIINDKLSVYSCYKKNVGLTRNEALARLNVSACDWIAFVDDDDTVAPTYVEKLEAYANSETHPQIVHFDNGLGEWGISFAVKSHFVNSKNIMFTTGYGEDADFYFQCINHGARSLKTKDHQYMCSGSSGWKRPEFNYGKFCIRLRKQLQK